MKQRLEAAGYLLGLLSVCLGVDNSASWAVWIGCGLLGAAYVSKEFVE